MQAFYFVMLNRMHFICNHYITWKFNLLSLQTISVFFIVFIQILGVEMLSVLHRVLLTRDSLDIHLAAMRVVRQIVKAAQESLDSKKAAVTE